MKTFEDINNWLLSIKEYVANAPEGARVVPGVDGKYSRYKMENVSPEAIKEFMAANSLVESKEHGSKVYFYETEYICVLDFQYPFRKKREECTTPREFYKNTPKFLNQSYYRLIWRKPKEESTQPAKDYIF